MKVSNDVYKERNIYFYILNFQNQNGALSTQTILAPDTLTQSGNK